MNCIIHDCNTTAKITFVQCPLKLKEGDFAVTVDKELEVEFLITAGSKERNRKVAERYVELINDDMYPLDARQQAIAEFPWLLN